SGPEANRRARPARRLHRENRQGALASMHADTGPRTGSFGALGAIVAGALILQVASTILNTVLPLQLAVANQPPWLIGLVGSAYSVGFLVGCFRIPSLIRRIGHIRGFAVFSAVQASLALSFALLP